MRGVGGEGLRGLLPLSAVLSDDLVELMIFCLLVQVTVH